MTTLPFDTKHPVYKGKIYLTAFIVALITFLVYLPALQNGFVNFDDHEYVYKNQHIQTMNLRFFSWILTTFHFSNWHPLTWLSHAIDYSLWGLNPLGHHISSVFFHGLNTFLVVLVVIRLMESTKNKGLPLFTAEKEKQFSERSFVAGAVTGLLFGIHPIHVESVAWVSERKDVLCAFFFLLSLLFYLKYSSSKAKKRLLPYVFCLLFFILSLMSKPMAVTLPVVLIILDFYPLRRSDFRSSITSQGKLFLEKIPFLFISLSSSIVTLLAQKSGGAIKTIPIADRILVAIRALFFYLSKMVWPSDLSPLYPYPSKISFFTPQYMGAFILMLCITAFCIWSWKKYKIFLAAWLYYIITLVPVLGIVQIGSQAAADRYTYLPSLGPFLLTGLAFSLLWEKTAIKIQSNIFKKLYMLILFLLLIAPLSITTITQIRIWKDSFTLWNIALKVSPDSYIAYRSRGLAYLNAGIFEKAIADSSKSIELNPFFGQAYHDRGKAFLMLDNFQEAIRDFNKAIELGLASEFLHIDRRLAYVSAIKYYSSVIESNPDEIESYINRGTSFAMIGQFNQALGDFNTAISLNPKFAIAYYNRGLVYRNLGNVQNALDDFQRAARLGDEKAQKYLADKGISW